MLISSTIPSYPVGAVSVSKLNIFANEICAPPAGTARYGETRKLSPTAKGSGAKISFGAVFGDVVEVTHAVSAPVALLVQLAGSAGAVTVSKD